MFWRNGFCSAHKDTLGIVLVLCICGDVRHILHPKNESALAQVLPLDLESYLTKLNEVETTRATGWRGSVNHSRIPAAEKLHAETLIPKSQPCIHKLEGWTPKKQDALRTGRAGVCVPRWWWWWCGEGGRGCSRPEGRPRPQWLTSAYHQIKLTAAPLFLPKACPISSSELTPVRSIISNPECVAILVCRWFTLISRRIVPEATWEM